MAKQKTPRTKTVPAADLPRKIYEVRFGGGLAFGGFIVVETYRGVERVLCWTQSIGASGPYEDDADEQRDYANMFRIAKRCLANPDYIERSTCSIDYRCYGLPNSAEPMPDFAYRWLLSEPGTAFKSIGRQFFPYCRFRYEKMLVDRSFLLHMMGRPMPFGEIDMNGKATSYPWVEAAHRDRTRQECTPETASQIPSSTLKHNRRKNP